MRPCQGYLIQNPAQEAGMGYNTGHTSCMPRCLLNIEGTLGQEAKWAGACLQALLINHLSLTLTTQQTPPMPCHYPSQQQQELLSPPCSTHKCTHQGRHYHSVPVGDCARRMQSQTLADLGGCGAACAHKNAVHLCR
eukprot:GHUV01054624.1.p1 GENE.GHUV01054624.1~~GHUV01054624.1.p1  ORF type:complete len:137 (+),score=26.71 GHUV01054624.1:101-511(+)